VRQRHRADSFRTFACARGGEPRSGKPRVPVSVVAANLEEYFPPSKIHSGESDFDPPRFKPDPDVYLLAAESEGIVRARARPKASL
jgi:beta-phosphoglucomutase-like phosphatase (HAD superfamily)